MPVRRLDWGTPGAESAFADLISAKRDFEDDATQAANAIVEDVRTRGDVALLEYTARFDRLDVPAVAALRVPADDLAAARKACDPAALAALELAAARIRTYHEKQVPADLTYTDDAGVMLGWRWTPVDSAGLYVPGGTAAYPSSVLMNALPAKVAGVGRLVVSVPTPDGKINPLVLAACHIAGVDEVWRMGGAQAIAALAYGTDTIAAVDKIVGPGNAYVAAAKRRVFGTVGIDMEAGPSEILVVADAANDPDWVAADLLSQAEHDASAQSILITEGAAFADAVAEAVERRLQALPRQDIARASWEANGGIIVVADLLADAPGLVDRIAPEHLELAVADPQVLAANIRHAGAIFMGRHTPEALGDYMAGPSHVLPTSGAARFASGLGVHDFLKRTSLVAASPEGFAELASATAALADAEGLGAHALSVRVRTNNT